MKEISGSAGAMDLRLQKAKNWHLFSVLGTKFLLDVKTGVVHEIDDVAWDLVSLYGEMPEDDLAEHLERRYAAEAGEGVGREAMAQLRELVAEGLLSPLDDADENAALELVKRADTSIIKALCLHVSHDCNLRCGYCFAGTGPFGGSRENMSPETGKRAVDFLIEASGPRVRIEVDFFGGEPFLAFDTVREVVEYAERRAREAEKSVGFTLTTNCTLFDQESLDYLREHQVSIVLSLDGRPEVNDRFRKFAGGRGTYDAVLSGIRKFVEHWNETGGAAKDPAVSRSARPADDGTGLSPKNRYYYVRGTYTNKNLDFASDVTHIADLGFSAISMEPVIADPKEDYAIREEHLPKIFAEYERLAEEYVRRRREGRGFSFFHFNVALAKGPCLARRLAGCGAGYQYLAVTPDGRLYPCHQFVGRDEFLMGTLESGITRPDLVGLFARANIYEKDGCASCWARFLCSGGCHANCHSANGSIMKPHSVGCKITRKRLECALGVQAVLSQGAGAHAAAESRAPDVWEIK